MSFIQRVETEIETDTEPQKFVIKKSTLFRSHHKLYPNGRHLVLVGLSTSDVAEISVDITSGSTKINILPQQGSCNAFDAMLRQRKISAYTAPAALLRSRGIKYEVRTPNQIAKVARYVIENFSFDMEDDAETFSKLSKGAIIPPKRQLIHIEGSWKSIASVGWTVKNPMQIVFGVAEPMWINSVTFTQHEKAISISLSVHIPYLLPSICTNLAHVFSQDYVKAHCYTNSTLQNNAPKDALLRAVTPVEIQKLAAYLETIVEFEADYKDFLSQFINLNLAELFEFPISVFIPK